MTAAPTLPLTRTIEPATAADLQAALRDAYDNSAPVYPLGGNTAQNVGLLPKVPGIGLSTTQLNRVIDYPSRDMTITVEAGITLAALSQTLAECGQRLPIDVPQADRATLGGVIATNHSGPLRYSQGTIRDYVLGISAVDGAGRPFRGGGRVVKNVAGYDFCKLLVGSLGTLGVVTQATLKVKPVVRASTLLTCELPDWASIESLLAQLVNTAITPAFVEVVSGAAWQATAPRLLVGVEGSAVEVAWMRETLQQETPHVSWLNAGPWHADSDPAHATYNRLIHFADDNPTALTLKIAARPGTLTSLAQLALSIDPQASLQAHAGNGILLVHFTDFPATAISRDLIGRLQPAAIAAGGHATVLAAASPADLTRQAVWGNPDAAGELMRNIKSQFDPRGILNPGRFVV